MEHCKLQIGCLVVASYVAFVYLSERRRIPPSQRNRLYEALLIIGVVSLALDALTAYTVNDLERVHPMLNATLHCLFLLSLDTLIFTLALYLLHVTNALPQTRGRRLLLGLPYVINVGVVVAGIGSLRYHQGEVSNYSMGLSAYTCFVMAGVYLICTLFIAIRRWRYLPKNRRVGIFTCLGMTLLVTGYQMLVPEALISCIATTMLLLGAYMNQEDPAMQELAYYHDEMVMGFATLVENRDSSTGGHIRRTTRYVKLLADALRATGRYRNMLTRDYMHDLLTAAPMHDIGKIAIPDAVLQKPGRLTPEEYELMKTHSARGGQIIRETFGQLNDEAFLDTAYKIARYHHERWDGAGYPDGLKGEEIPLCARIMAIADVFDAVSEDRCYRPALPLDECFRCIAEGSGTAFDPVLAHLFLDIRPQVEAIFHDVEAQERARKRGTIGASPLPQGLRP